MKKETKKILAITLVLLLLLISSFYVLFLKPEPMQTTVDTQGAWWITQAWLGWRNQDNVYQKYATFYDGESIQGCDYTLTYKQSEGYGNPTKWKVTVEIQDKNHNRVKGTTVTGGALAVGQTVTAVCDFSPIELSSTNRLHGDVWIEIYNTNVGWEGGQCVSNLPINVQPNLPSFTLDYYQVSATTAKAGDTLTVSYQYTNTGRASGTLYVALWADKWKRGENYGDMELYTKKSEQIAVGGTLSDTMSVQILDNYASDDNIIRLGLNNEIKQITYTPPIYSLTIVTVPAQCLVTTSGKSVNSGTAGAVFSLGKGTYSVTVTKDKYSPKTETVALDQSKTVIVTLSQIIYDLEINTTPLSTVEVKNVDTKYADENGTVTFKLIPNTYAIVISKSGYTAKSLSITVDKNMIYTQALEKSTVPTPPPSTPPPTTPPTKKTPGFETAISLIALALVVIAWRKRRE